MNGISAKETKDSCGPLIDTPRATPIVLSVEEHERLKAIESEKACV
jgi:hypothetical protein